MRDLDDGFFEKFGSLLRQKSQFNEDSCKLAPMPEEASGETVQPVNVEYSRQISTRMGGIEEGDDSGTETLQESEESETEDQQHSKQTSFIDSVVGWNVSKCLLDIFVVFVWFFNFDGFELINMHQYHTKNLDQL